MNSRERNANNAKFAEVIDKLISTKLEQALKKILSTKEVVIKKIYNADNYTKRSADVVFVDDLSQTVTIKSIPINIPQYIAIGDVATLFYLNNKPNNGWIGNLITFTAEGEIIAPPIDSELFYGVVDKVTLLENNQFFHYTGVLETTQDQTKNVWLDTSQAEKITGVTGFSAPMQNDDDIIIDLTKK